MALLVLVLLPARSRLSALKNIVPVAVMLVVTAQIAWKEIATPRSVWELVVFAAWREAIMEATMGYRAA